VCEVSTPTIVGGGARIFLACVLVKVILSSYNYSLFSNLSSVEAINS
jgi:hypothetical protein